ncbi:acyltransferase [Brevundimonas sp.]|uniref:acyltransferase n=1 Tax=Brevundimonas sp. TaxID=1871086 RepID=UPI002D66FE91|nr:acyltransferase [Brevundimonas sp.]HYC69244.1 acyltransferase [Brevundimonas sp.]
MKTLSAGFWNSEELRALGVARVGENVGISRSCEVIGLENIEVGDNVRIDAFCAIIATGPVRLGSWIHIGGGCLLSGRGGITMEDFSGLSGGVMIYSASDDYTGRHMTNPMVPAEFTGVKVAPVRLGRHAIVGAGSVILPGVTLGEGSVLGATSLATRPIAPWTIHSGSPARRIADRARGLLDKEARLLNLTAPASTEAA